MIVAIAGGKLQGTEVTYLANAAGYETIVIDRKEDAQAFGIADYRVVADILEEPERVKEQIKNADVLIPAVENQQVLDILVTIGKELAIPVVFDQEAYAISSSKIKSNELFTKLSIPMPRTYPECDYPVVIKPDNQSGSVGIKKAFSREEAEDVLKDLPVNTVVQEYLEGRSFSLEVIGDGEQYLFPQITEVVVDKQYDCKRIIAPARITSSEEKQLHDMAEKLAKALKIKGIFDIEVISYNGKLKILEIDARMPSQTPISVYQSCGVNMVELLVQIFLAEKVNLTYKEQKVCFYQQIQVTEKSITVLGEHVMGQCGQLHKINDFFGADEALTDYEPDRKNFCAIVIVRAETEDEAYTRFQDCEKLLKKETGREEAVITEG